MSKIYKFNFFLFSFCKIHGNFLKITNYHAYISLFIYKNIKISKRKYNFDKQF